MDLSNPYRKKAKKRSINYYDYHQYDDFWIGRDYEHLAEVLAIKKLLGTSQFSKALDYGGGYGRLVPLLTNYAKQVILADPSQKQLDYAQSHLKTHNFSTLWLENDGVITLPSESLDLVIMIRVSHHLIVPTKNFREIYRVLKPGGKAIIEIANSAHLLNRIKWAAKLKAVPAQPIPIGEYANGIVDDVPFVNHHPKTIITQLDEAKLKYVKGLSVSNLRSQRLKKYIPIDRMLKIEAYLQPKLSAIRFGPSFFILVQK